MRRRDNLYDIDVSCWRNDLSINTFNIGDLLKDRTEVYIPQQLKEDCIKRILNLIQKLNLDLRLCYYKENSSQCRFDLRTNNTRIKQILALEYEFKNILGDTATLDYSNGFLNIILQKVNFTPLSFKRVILSAEFQSNPAQLKVALGEDIEGNVVVGDLEKWVHVLVAGSTGGGKSVCLHTIILSLLLSNDPTTLKLILFDLKRVELTQYDYIPHLLNPVITDVRAAIKTLDILVSEMNRRYELLREHRCRNITSYNQRTNEKIPYIIVVIDEFANLILSDKQVERYIVQLSQMARASGIHIILSTQKPSSEVVTGLIKANIETRIAFSVPSHYDSQIILDEKGAEKLSKKGDAILKGENKKTRFQGAFVDEEEIGMVVNYLINTYGIYQETHNEVEDYIDEENNSLEGYTIKESNFDPLINGACKLVIERKKASINSLRKYLGIGYNRADKIISQLKEIGVIGEYIDSLKTYEVLMDHDDIVKIL